ncbi:hypothetical protein B4Q13_18250 [Lacticaseibacillus rhamnosus]
MFSRSFDRNAGISVTTVDLSEILGSAAKLGEKDARLVAKVEAIKAYADAKRLNVPFVFSSNGHQFVEYDRFSGLTSAARPLSDFPSPAEVRTRYEQGVGFSLDDTAAHCSGREGFG